MIHTYLTALLILVASLLSGRAILHALGARTATWLSGVTGFSTLVILAPFLLRLPGRATTAAIIFAFVLLVAAAIVVTRSPTPWRSGRGERESARSRPV
ncbi:MAG TPA: hypothetical protein VK919_08920, partial [Solirubrobacterales bacterium]|nr:hypothetical protein [Solirubrobacterales bacterium]